MQAHDQEYSKEHMEYLHTQYVLKELAKAEEEENDPSKWMTEDAFWREIDAFMDTLPERKDAV